MSESQVGLLLVAWLLLVVLPVAVWHLREYRKGGAYDPTRPEALVAWHASQARKAGGQA